MLPIRYDTLRAGYAAGWHSAIAYDRWLKNKHATTHAVGARFFDIYETLYLDAVDTSGVFSRAATNRRAA